MTFVESVKTCFQKYITFSGRASRSEFWWFASSFWLAQIAFSSVGLDTISGLIFFGTVIPYIAVTWRRMHDAGNSGAHILLPAAILISSIYIQMFSLMVPMMRKMKELVILPEMTIRELNELQMEAVGSQEFTLANTSYLAIVIFALGSIWMIYLLARRSNPSPNQFGPNPHEVPQ